MSKDDFPIGMDTEGVLSQLYGFINTWKLKLFDALTSGKLPDEVCADHGLNNKILPDEVCADHGLNNKVLPDEVCADHGLNNKVCYINLKRSATSCMSRDGTTCTTCTALYFRKTKFQVARKDF